MNTIKIDPPCQVEGWICSYCFHHFDDDCTDMYDRNWNLSDDMSYEIDGCDCVLCGERKLGERYRVWREEA